MNNYNNRTWQPAFMPGEMEAMRAQIIASIGLFLGALTVNGGLCSLLAGIITWIIILNSYRKGYTGYFYIQGKTMSWLCLLAGFVDIYYSVYMAIFT